VKNDTKVVGVKLVPPATWVSFVGVVASVLQSRKVKCELADVAGMSGYAFLVNVHRELCPSGPTAFDWEMLAEGTSALGLDVQLVATPRDKEKDAGNLRDMFDRVKQEIDAGRCCVVWGAACSPEFGVVYGYNADSYLVRTYATCRALGAKAAKGVGPEDWPEQPIRYDKLESPGCISAFLFGESVKVDRERAERAAVTRAAQLLRDRHPCYLPGYAHGAAGLRAWAESLSLTPKAVNPFGNAYNARCWQELQELGAAFLKGLGKRHKGAAKALNEASSALGRSAGKLAEVSKLFPFPEGGGLDDATRRSKAAKLLAECATLNETAARGLEWALGLM
jgi:hypothetical protein